MSRTAQDGLIYFPVDVNIFEDDKMLIAQDLIDPDGKDPFLRFCIPYVAIRLLREIYVKGYHMEWNDQICRIQASKISNGVTSKVLSQIVDCLIKAKFFDLSKYEALGILTSHGIQKRWLLIMKLCRRNVKPIKKEFILVESVAKKSVKLEKKIIVQESIILVQLKPFVVTEMMITSGKLLQERAFPFIYKYNKSIGNKGVISNEYLIALINYKINKKEKEKISLNATEKGIPATEKGIPATEKGIPATEKGIPATEKGIPATEKGIPATEIHLNRDDLEMLAKMPQEFKDAWLLWLNYMSEEHGVVYKSKSPKEQSLRKILELSEYNSDKSIEILKNSISNRWKTFYKLEDGKQNGKRNNGTSAGLSVTSKDILQPGDDFWSK